MYVVASYNGTSLKGKGLEWAQEFIVRSGSDGAHLCRGEARGDRNRKAAMRKSESESVVSGEW